jgi:acetyl coenzyme A synthetase (ADP forming)-like protein
LRPRSIAVVGTSRKPGSIGREVLTRLVEGGFRGPLYPINPASDVIGSLRAYPTVTACPGPVDLAVIAVPRDKVLAVLDDCAVAKVGGLVVITSGFKEVGPAGAALEQQLVERVRRAGMRMVGPNCMGVLNSDPAINLNATFAPGRPPSGPIGFISQSGALGMAVLDFAQSRDLGIGMFVSTGNKADVSGNDLLDYWEHDPSIRLILMYVESFGNPLKFRELAERIGREKPIVVVKAGRTAAGARAAASHTGALAGEDALCDALFHQCGVIRAQTVEELFDIALAFAHQPLPGGNRVGIVTNSGGPGIMLADACEMLGLAIPGFSPETETALRELLPEEASVGNPVDMIASATEESFQRVVGLVAADPQVDAVIVVFLPPVLTDPERVAVRLGDLADRLASGRTPKPILGCVMGARRAAGSLAELQKHRVPSYAFPESAAKALSAMVRYQAWRKRPRGSVPRFPSGRLQAEQVIEGVQQAGREWLSEKEVGSILRAYGIPMVKSVSAGARGAVADAAHEVGYPIVIKISSPAIIHKARVGGVIVDIRTDEELRLKLDDLEKRLAAQGFEPGRYGFVVQPMLAGGREVIMGLSRTPKMGPLVMFGLGGIFVETVKDIVFRLAPITDREAMEMITGIRAYPILKGLPGEAGVAVQTLQEMLLRLSQMAVEVPEIAELDLNPVLAFPESDRCAAVDARIRVGPGGARVPVAPSNATGDGPPPGKIEIPPRV